MKKKKRKAIFMDEELYDRIKKEAEKNNRKITDELKSKYGIK